MGVVLLSTLERGAVPVEGYHTAIRKIDQLPAGGGGVKGVNGGGGKDGPLTHRGRR